MSEQQERPPESTRDERQKAIDDSMEEVKKAHEHLELKLKEHKETLSAMFFAM